MMPSRVLVVLAFLFTPAIAVAEEPTYWNDIRPLLRKHCTVCHSERRLDKIDVSGGLALDSLEAIRAGGRDGKVPVLVPKKPDESLLVTLLTSKDPNRAMPRDTDPLSADDIATFRKWVAAGAPEGTKPNDTETGVIAKPPVNVRKLPVTFATNAAFPTEAKLPGAVSLTLPIGPLPPVAAVAFSPDGRLLASGIYGRVTVWDMNTAKPITGITNVLGSVNDLQFSPDGKLLAVAGGQPSARGDLRLFDTTNWKLVHSLGGHLDTVSGVAFRPDGTRLASASFDKTVRLWDVKSGKVLHTFTGHSDFVYAVAFGPKGDWYATVSKDRTGRLVDVKTGKSKVTFSGMNEEVLAVAVRPDGQVATSGFESQIHWWDANTAQRVNRTAGPGNATHELAFNAKGTVMAVAGGDGTVRFYKPDGTLLKVGQVGSTAFAVALDASGKRAAVGNADGLVQLWDVTDGRLLVTMWSGADDNWLSLTPEGYAIGAETAMAKATWKAGNTPMTDENLLAPLHNAEQVGKATRGEKLTAPVWK